jgi:hypothetical protein
MELKSRKELEVARRKLRILEERYAATERRQGGDERVRELSLCSLKKLMNQFTEEIVRFEAHMKTPAGS